MSSAQRRSSSPWGNRGSDELAAAYPLFTSPSRLCQPVSVSVVPTADERIVAYCSSFTRLTLEPNEPLCIRKCEAASAHTFMGPSERSFLEAILRRIYNFLSGLDALVRHPAIEFVEMPHLKLPPKPTFIPPRLKGLTPEEQKKAREYQQLIRDRKKELEKERQKLAALRQKLDGRLADAEAQRRKVEAELDKVRPELQAAQEGLNAIKDEYLYEVRSYPTPPKMVATILEAVLLVLGEKQTSWDRIKLYIRKDDFIPTVREFDPAKVPDTTRRALQKIVDDPALTEEAAHRASKAAAPLLKWIRAIKHYADALILVKAMRAELDRLNELINEARDAIAEQQSIVDRLQHEVDEMERYYDEHWGESYLNRLNAAAKARADEAFAELMADWRRRCDELRAEHDKWRPPPMARFELQSQTLKIVEDTRNRCYAVVNAITATAELCSTTVAPTLVVQRGHLAVASAAPQFLAEGDEMTMTMTTTSPRRHSTSAVTGRRVSQSPARGNPIVRGSPGTANNDTSAVVDDAIAASRSKLRSASPSTFLLPARHSSTSPQRVTERSASPALLHKSPWHVPAVQYSDPAGRSIPPPVAFIGDRSPSPGRLYQL